MLYPFYLNNKFILCTLALSMLLLCMSEKKATAQLSADFSVSRKTGCSPLVVNFTDQSSGNPTSWEWKFGNGNSSTSQNPSTIYSNSGFKTITLIVSDGTNADTVIKQNHIEVFATPDVDFTASPKTECEPITVDFTDQSTPGSGTLDSWTWDFPGGDPGNSGSPNPTGITYSQCGSYNVTLIVTNSKGCQDFATKSDFIQATCIPEADFISQDTFGCQVPHTANFIDSSETNASMNYNWDFGDGNTGTGPKPSHTYQNTGLYDVTLDVITPSGCADTITKPAYIQVDSLVADFEANDTLICKQEAVQFNSTVTGSSTGYQWTFDGAHPPTNNKDPTITFDTIGTFDVELIVTFPNNCSDTVQKSDYIEVQPIPDAAFTTDSTTVDCQTPLTVNFNDNSSNATSWLWDFGDGNTSTQQNPIHTYTSEGNFNVSLTVTNTAGCTHTETKTNFVEINFPEADFSLDPEKGCAPLTVDFTDTSTANEPITSWNWHFDDGSDTTIQDPTHTYTDTGVYEPILTITTVSGCVDSFTIPSPIEVGDTSTVDFTAAPTQVCWQDQVNFTDLSGQNTDNWLWEFGDGQNANQQDPIHAYEDTGTYDVTLIATYNGCSDTLVKNDYIQVAPPIPDFTFSPTCNPPLQFSFTDQSEAADLWEWDFDDGGATSNQQDPTYTFSSPGQYTVELTVTDTISGCQKTKTEDIQVTQPNASLTADQVDGCRPFDVNFANTSSFSDNTSWFIPSSSSSPVGNQDSLAYTFSNAGKFSVKMVNCDATGCCDTIIKQDYITVNGSNPDFTLDSNAGCLPHTVSFTDQSSSQFSSIADWQWDFGDGSTSNQQNPTHTFNQRGAYDVTLTVTDTFGCSNSETKNNLVSSLQPIADFATISDTFCRNQAFSFNNQSSGTQLSYAWNFGDGSPVDSSANPSHQYANNGTYSVSLYVEDNYGCDSMIQRSLTVQDPEVGFFADDTVDECPPFLVDFTDTTKYNIPVSSWRWEFGDSTFSNQQDASHIYTEPGVYDVSLFVEFANGCRDTIVKNNLIDLGGPDGNLTFSPREGCTPLDVCFDANSTNAIGHIYDFGDGNVTSGPDSICHNYTSNGIYHPTVLLSDTAGCNFLLEANDSVVVDTPVADFGISTKFACQPAVVSFYDSTNTKVDIAEYQWDFGDGDTDTVANPTHVFDSAGTFTVSLTVINELGCQNSTTEQVTVHPQPKAAFKASDTIGCEPVTVQFTDQSTAADTAIVSRKWYFGDSDSSSTSNPTHVYDSSGTFTATLVVTDKRGCTDTAYQKINILALPDGISVSDTTICANDTIELVTSQGDSLYNWTPGYGLSDSTVASPLAYPDTTTEYSLDVLGQNGCPFKDSILVTVISLPKLTVSPSPDTSMCFGDTVEISAQGEGVDYNWIPPDGLTNPDSSFSKASPASTTTYLMQHTDTNGCSNYDSVKVIVNRSIAKFEEPVACLEDTSYFTDQSINIGGQIIEWQWDFGDGTTDSVPNPAHLYDSEGTYPVNLFVKDNNGCEDDTTVDVEVDPLPTATFSIPDTLCAKTPATFRDLSSSNDGIRGWEWNFGDGSQIDTVKNPSHSFPDSGYYNVTLTVIDSNFCREDTTIQVFVDPRPTVNFVADNECFGQPIQFFDSTQSDTILTKYRWDFDDGGTTSKLKNPSYLYSKPGTYGVNLQVTDINGCSQDTTIDVTVWELPDPDYQAGPVCLGDTMTFQDNTKEGDAPLTQWSWDFGDGIGTDTIRSPSYAFIDSGFYNVSLQVRDTNNCQNEISKQIRVDHPADPYASPDTLICAGESVQLQGGGGDSIVWRPADDLTNPTDQSPIATPDATTSYALNAKNGVCSFDTALAKIEVIPLPYLQAPDEQRLLKGDSVKLPTFANSSDAIMWEPSTDLSCDSCPRPIASPLETQEYQVTAVDTQYGCVNKDSTVVSVYEQCEEEQVFVPNTFTPNGDGRNDRLYARTLGVKELIHFRVFDRWGELMFETDNFNEGWDGTNPSGKKLSSGVYVYVVKVLCYNNVKLTTSGNVTIIK